MEYKYDLDKLPPTWLSNHMKNKIDSVVQEAFVAANNSMQGDLKNHKVSYRVKNMELASPGKKNITIVSEDEQAPVAFLIASKRAAKSISDALKGKGLV